MHMLKLMMHVCSVSMLLSSQAVQDRSPQRAQLEQLAAAGTQHHTFKHSPSPVSASQKILGA